MRSLFNDEIGLIAGSDLDGDAGEKEAREYMDQQNSFRTVEYCQPLFGSFTGLEECFSIRFTRK